MNRHGTFAATAAFATAVAVGGCGSNPPSPPQRSGTGPIGSTATHKLRRAHRLRIIEVAIRAHGFKPRLVSLRRGARVEWVNDDDRAHTVTSLPGSPQHFDSGRIAPGDRFALSTVKRGRVRYRSTAPGDGKRFRGVVEVG